MIKTVVSIELPVGERMLIRKNRIAPANTTAKEQAKLPRICIVTGTHGDELEGQYVCYRLNQLIGERPERLRGVVDIYPATNPLGIDSITRGFPLFDLDMNRIFPGSKGGTSQEVIAAKLIADMKGADAVIDIHASNIFLREIPQVRINVNMADRLTPLARLLNCDVIWVHGAATVLESTLAHALNSIGTPCLVVEMGVGMRITKDYGERITQGILNLMAKLGVWSEKRKPSCEPILSKDGKVGFVNAQAPGVFVPEVTHWMNIHKGELLGRIIDPMTGATSEKVKSPCNGLVFTLREYPVVNPGSLIARVLDTEPQPEAGEEA
ncbi:MAG: succinylglutamate desuccinylase/aspartoacylase family protein [Duodenibacillus sp.]|nr:succinylglutamate desuccinylase/aspartoacylase family protein [Duodenibacillus sp.]